MPRDEIIFFVVAALVLGFAVFRSWQISRATRSQHDADTQKSDSPASN